MSVCVCVSLMLVAMVAGCEKPPEPNYDIHYDFEVTDALRDGLTPKGREFFDLMKAGKVLGCYERDFQKHFRDVVLKQESDGSKLYFFSFVGRKQDYEGEPVIAVTIHKRSGRIIQCSVYTPCW